MGKRCMNCDHRVARFKCQEPQRQYCSFLDMGTNGTPRAWVKCKGVYWKAKKEEGR